METRHLAWLLKELEDQPDSRAVETIKAVLANDTESNRLQAAEAIVALAPRPMPMAQLGASALLALGAPASFYEWVTQHGDDGGQVLWAVDEDGLDLEPALDFVGRLLEQPATQESAARCLGRLGAPAAGYAPRLRELVEEHGVPDAAEALGALGDLDSIELLTSAVRQTEDDVLQEYALRGLGNLGAAAEPAVPVIRGLVGHDEIVIATVAVNALREIGARDAATADALAAALRDEQDPDRCAALLRTVGSLGAPSRAARIELQSALESGDLPKRCAATVARYLSDREPGPVRDAISNPETGVETATVLRFWEVGLDPFFEPLLALLGRYREVKEEELPPLVGLASLAGAKAMAGLQAIAADETTSRSGAQDFARQVLDELAESDDAQPT